MDAEISIINKQEEDSDDNVCDEFSQKSTTLSKLEHFCALSEDQEILPAKGKNATQPNLSQQKEHIYDNRHFFRDDFFAEKEDVFVDFDDEVVSMALEIASFIEEQHPTIRPYISMYLMKKYFDVDINHYKFRDHAQCNLH